ncbi:MAG: EAL domain-containing protein [Synechococcaceae cyanobacterium]
MTPLRRLLRSWWKEERHAPPRPRTLRTALALALLLLAPLFLVHLRHRALSGQSEQQQRLQEGLGIVEAAYGSLTRTAFDWGHWDSLYSFVSGTNPNFPGNDIQTTAVFDGGLVMLLLEERGQLLFSHTLGNEDRQDITALVRCANGGLYELVNISSTVRLFCRNAKGNPYLGIATPISNSMSTAPRRGSLVFLDPLMRQEYTTNIRHNLQRFQRNLSLRAEAHPGPNHTRGDQPILPLIHSSDGRLLALREQPIWPILLQVLLEDLVLVLAFCLGLLGFRSTLLLERRRQRLISRRRERRGDARIRRVCRDLDDLHAELGINAHAASQGSLALARLLHRRLSTSGEASQTANAAPPPEDSAQVATPAAAAPAAMAATGSEPPSSRLDLDHRLQRLANRFQDFLESAQTLALIDPLTQLPNRRFFLEQLATLARSCRDSQSRYAVLFVDVDRFKAINDTFGHHYGDEVLKTVAQRLRQQLRLGDFLARYGGDELAILMDLSDVASGSEADQRAAAHQCASRLCDSLAEPVLVGDLPIELSLSVGIALVDPNLTEPARAMQQSDLAMYWAKRNKHSRIAIFDMDDAFSTLDSYQLYLDLMQAVRQKQLQVLFQPIVNRQGELLAVEALARWNHPERGAVPPEEFLDLAEHHRQLGVLWQAILERSLHDFATLKQQLPSLHLAINLSPSQLSDQQLVPQIRQELERCAIPPTLLTIEITERVILEASALVRQNLKLLRDLGIRIALDDFGTGHSSLTLLSELRPDELKIDRSFVAAMARDPYAEHIVQVIANLARSLAIDLVAEGVEDLNILTTLEQLGVDCFQGYLVSPPLPWFEISALAQAGAAKPMAPAFTNPQGTAFNQGLAEGS